MMFQVTFWLNFPIDFIIFTMQYIFLSDCKPNQTECAVNLKDHRRPSTVNSLVMIQNATEVQTYSNVTNIYIGTEILAYRNMSNICKGTKVRSYRNCLAIYLHKSQRSGHTTWHLNCHKLRAFIHMSTLYKRQLFGHTETYNIHGFEHSMDCYI